MNVSAPNYLECANIYKGNSPKKKTDLIEMIVYGCITEKLKKKGIEDISTKQANLILNKSNNSKIITWIWKCFIKKKK